MSIRIYVEPYTDVLNEEKYWKFNRRNVNRIAKDRDAKVICWDPDTKSARLRDYLGRLLWVEHYKSSYD